jgi:DNA-binding MarR family transcriptional regulator
MAEEVFDLTVLTWRERVMSRHSIAAELSESQFLTLDLLQQQAPQTVGELQRGIGVLPAQMSRIIRSMESHFEKPLITCALNPHDKRKIDVTSTVHGKQVYDEFRQARLAKILDVLARLPDSDRIDFVRICQQIKPPLRAAIDRPAVV